MDWLQVVTGTKLAHVDYIQWTGFKHFHLWKLYADGSFVVQKIYQKLNPIRQLNIWKTWLVTEWLVCWTMYVSRRTSGLK